MPTSVGGGSEQALIAHFSCSLQSSPAPDHSNHSARMAGFLGTPLPKKLGIRAGDRLLLLEAPEHLAALLGELPQGVTISSRLTSKGQFDIVVLFMTRLSELQRRFQAVVNHLNPSGGFWVAWPKKAS